MADIEVFRNHIIEAGVLDPDGVHQEFVSGMHGQKLDFDTVEEETSLYREWISVAADFIGQEYSDRLPEVIIGVANGTNRVALDTARRFDGEVLGLVSKKDKDNSKVLYLGTMATRVISALQPKLVVVLEDVGTTGSNSVQVARHVLDAGAQEAEVVTTWKRREKLEKLIEAGIAYRAIIDEELPAYQPEDCRADGFCAQGWEFIPRSK